MPIFRPGKPWAVLSLSVPTVQSAGLAPFPFDVVESDGEWTSLGPTTMAVALSGFYVVSGRVHRPAGGASSSLTGGVLISGELVSANTADASSGERWAGASWMGQLEAGDTIALAVAGTSVGAPASVIGTGLTAVRVGPVRWT